MADGLHVILGEHELPVYPQPPTRVTKRLGRLRDAFQGAVDERVGLDKEQLLGGLGKRVYYLFVTFIPNLPERMPEWEFWGYSSRDAFEADDFDEDRDGKGAATFPQWLDAFDAIVEVNGGKRFMDLLGKVFPAEILKAEMGLALSEWRESTGSPSSLSTKAGSEAQTSSGTTVPTSDEPATSEPGSNGHSSGSPLSVSA